MRAFLALDLDGPTSDALSALQAQLRLLDLDATFPRPEQLHVTLCFFNDSEDEISGKIQKLQAFSSPAFDAELSGVSFFPSPAFVRVVWASFGKGKENALDLQKKITSFLKHKETAPFVPHVTLARIKSPKNKERFASFAKTCADFSVQFRASRVSLYQSRLSLRGPDYVCLHSLELSPPV